MTLYGISTYRLLKPYLLTVCLIALASLPIYPQNSSQQDKPYRILPGDLIEVRIEDAPELDRIYQINSNGTFIMPYLKCINAGNKTTDELATFLAEILRGRYLKDPKVHVTIRNNLPRSATKSTIDKSSFRIYGEVHSQGWFTLQEGMTLRDALSKAGGTTPNAEAFGYILRSEVDNCKRTKIEFNIGEVIKDDKNNPRLLPGDEVFIPARLSPNDPLLKPLLPSPQPNLRPTRPGLFGNVYART